MKVVLGKMNEFLGVVLDHSTPGVVNVDTRSHTGSVMSLGKGEIQSLSCKQKIKTRSSTQAELVSFDNILAKMMLTANVVFCDNQSSMKFETKWSGQLRKEN